MRAIRLSVLLTFLLVVASYSFAGVRIRSSSENGQGSSEPEWKLLGRSLSMTLTSHGNKVTLVREVICPGQTLSSGNCENGEYIFLFQLRGNATRLKVLIGKLPSVPTDLGVNQCNEGDDLGNSNTRQLCTIDTDPPTLANLANNITTNSKNKTSVNFLIPNIPAFPTGSDEEEGQGLTIFIHIKQSAPLPVTYPSVGLGTY